VIFDFYAQLAFHEKRPSSYALPGGLVSGFVDECATWFAVNELQAADYDAQAGREQDEKLKKALGSKKLAHERAKNEARRCYTEQAQTLTLQLPSELELERWPPKLLHDSWIAFAVEFELVTPWYSRDDRLFHVLDNPVRKDRVFGVPYMAAASWKGMLRWAMGMTMRLIGPDAIEDGQKRQEAEDVIDHLFGNKKGEKIDFGQGALVFYPTWFDKIGFEVINPHSRERRAGTQPIYYEVVPGRRPKNGDSDTYEEGGKGALHLLYAPWPGMKRAGKAGEMLGKLLEAIDTLLKNYGISAKRSVGWGTAEIKGWQAWRKGTAPDKPMKANDWRELWRKLLDSGGGA
jgi:CRISPR-associated protein Cmr2